MDFVRQKFPLLRLFVVTCYLALFVSPQTGAARPNVETPQWDVSALPIGIDPNFDLSMRFQKKDPGQKDVTGTHVKEIPSPRK